MFAYAAVARHREPARPSAATQAGTALAARVLDGRFGLCGTADSHGSLVCVTADHVQGCMSATLARIGAP